MDFGGQSCQTLGYYHGALHCSADCSEVDATSCLGYCGNGVAETDATGHDEECDGRDQRGMTCLDFSSKWTGGALGCDASCKRTTDACTALSWDTSDSGVITTQELYAVWGTGEFDVFAVGRGGTILRFGAPAAAWTHMDSQTTRDLHAIWGSSDSDIFAVGDDGMDGEIIHYDGHAWTPIPSLPSTTLRGVWGRSASDVFAVGNTILHYSGAGTNWTPMPLPNSNLAGIWGDADGDLFAVGNRVLRGDGWQWLPQFVPVLPFSGPETAVWGSSGTNIFAVRNDTDGPLHYDGNTWTQMDLSPMGMGAAHAVWGRLGTDVYVAGSGGSMLHYNGSGWSPVFSGVTVPLYGIWGTPNGGLFVVGAGGTILHAWDAAPASRSAYVVPIYCSGEYFGDTTGGPSMFRRYGCRGAREDTGPDVYYRLASPITGRMTVRLQPRAADLDLVVLAADAVGNADPDNGCLVASQQDGVTDEEITVPLETGKTYYLVVDGYDGAASGYTLDLQCQKQ
jgi:hypothetical protein